MLRATHQVAAKIWAEGVPWSEAMGLATKAMERANPRGKAREIPKEDPMPRVEAKVELLHVAMIYVYKSQVCGALNPKRFGSLNI